MYFCFKEISVRSLDNTYMISNYTETKVFSIIIQILSAFDYLHKKHFIYRDLKPDNVMIDFNKTAVLIDFDRMLNENEMNNDKKGNYHTYNHTKNFQSEYIAPETNSDTLNKI